ncbi:MAG: hypothetical protein R3E66_10565 [bacterium]
MAGHEDDDFPVQGFVTDPPTSSRYSDGLDEGTESEAHNEPDWSEIARFVGETASHILEEFFDVDDVPVNLDASTQHDIRDAVSPAAPVPPPPPKLPPSASDTTEIEIAELSADWAPDSVFDQTGIQFVDPDTGDVISVADVDAAKKKGANTKPQKFGIRLPGVDPLKLPGIWGAFLTELKEEIEAEPDPRHRAAYVYVFANVVRALTGVQTPPEVFESLADDAGAVLRSNLLERLAFHWQSADEPFFKLMARLERLDESAEGALGTIRRSSIAFERLLDGEASEATRQRLRERMIPPETFPALVVKAVEGHASHNLGNSINAWRRLGKHAHGELKRAATVMVPWLLHGNPAFFEVIDAMAADGAASRAQMFFVQREAHQTGNWWHEARALKRLVSQDGRIGQRAKNETEPAKKRLLRESAARLFRLATILERLQSTDLTGSDLEGLTSYRVLRDAVSLNATNFVMLRQLERWARARGDSATVEQALVSQAELVDDDEVKALIWERLAALHEQTTHEIRIMADYLQLSLEADADCLPTLISLGQQIILHGAFADMLELKGVPAGEELRAVQSAWRRAELLERTGGDPREILSLYRSARDENPESIHLFFCVERSLARIADWRGLRTLYDVTLEDEDLCEKLDRTGVVRDCRLAVEAFLEDVQEDLTHEWVEHLAIPGMVDDGAYWRVVSARVEAGEADAVLRELETLEFDTRGESTPHRARTLLWYTWLAEALGRDARGTVDAYRELFLTATGIFQRRYALLGLLRLRDFSWVADSVAAGDLSGFAITIESPSQSYRMQIAGELYALGGDYEAALDQFGNALDQTEEPVERAEAAERALHHAIRSRKWPLAFRFLPHCFDGEEPRSVAEFARHLAACTVDPTEVLERLDAANLQPVHSPTTILDELELAYRGRDWKRGSRLIGQGLSTAEAGSIDFRAFLLEQAILVGGWGWDAPEETVACLDDLWSLDASLPNASPFFAVAAYLRTYARLGRKEKVEEWSTFARNNFTQQVSDALLKEADVYVQARSGTEAAKWYRSRVETAPGPLQPYYRWMAATLAWMFEKRSPAVAQELVAATAAGDPTHRVGAFLVAIALVDHDNEGTARQLRMLRRAGNARAVQQWAMIRNLFHLATAQNSPDRAIELMEEESGLMAFDWSAMAVEVFSRSMRRTQAVERLRERARSARGARALGLEIAQILGDVGMFPRLASSGLPGAHVLVEVLTAQDELAHAPGWRVEARLEDLQRSISEESQEQVRRRLMAYLLEIDEVVFGSPWCPVRLVHADLTRFGLSIDELTALQRRVSTFGHDDIAAEARLMVARQFQRMGQRETALSLMPSQITDSCVSQAWALFANAIDPYLRTARVAHWALGFWSGRRDRMHGVDAEIAYELGHYSEIVGDDEAALASFVESLNARPTFLASQVAAGRLLIRRRDFLGLAKILEQEYHAAKRPEAQASLAFRLGYVWDRRLRGQPEANASAEAWFLKVLRVRPQHLPTLEALLEIAFRTQNWEAATQYLSRLADLAKSPTVQAGYLTELGSILEHQVNDDEAALDAYDRALMIDPDDVLAFLGVLRTSQKGDRGLAAILKRLDGSRSPREIEDLSHQLFVLARTNTRAREAVKSRFPNYYAIHLASLAESLEKRVFDVGSAVVLERGHHDAQTRLLIMAFERLGNPKPLAGNELLAASRVGADPFSEGRLIRAMHHAWRQMDLEALGLLATSRARRSSSPVVRSSELTWMVATQYLRGDREGALEVIERLLGQYMDFLPAVKIAKLLAEELGEWESVVRWFKRDAHLTRVGQISNANRLHASQVQKDHLGDLDAAVEQLRKVIAANPRHPEAFVRLKELLWTRRDFDDLLDAYEEQIRHSKSDDEIVGWLNEMADLALAEQSNRAKTIGYLTRSLERNGSQTRRLRMLGDLYEQVQNYAMAVRCFGALTKLLPAGPELQKLFAHIGHLLETQLSRSNDAKGAYIQALRLDPQDTRVLAALARVCEERVELQESLHYLAKILEVSSDSNVLRAARVSTFRVQGKANVALEELLATGGTLLLHHPEQLDAVDELRKRMTAAGRGEDVEAFFRNLAIEQLAAGQANGLQSHFEIAHRLGHADRAFRLASLGHFSGVAKENAKSYYIAHAEPRRWPKRPIPNEATSGLLPTELVAPFIELLRLSREAVEEAIEGKGADEYIKRNARVKEPKGLAMQLAWQWPQLYGLELRDVYQTDKTLPGHCDLTFDGGVRLVLDASWSKVADPTEQLVGLGRRLAALSMGIGGWSRLKPEEQIAVFVAVVSQFASGWTMSSHVMPDHFSSAKLARWLEKKGQRVAPYALEISGRFGAQAIERQCRLLQVAIERLACVVIDDPGRAIKFSELDLEPAGVTEASYAFLLDVPAERIRNAIGIQLKDA